MENFNKAGGQSNKKNDFKYFLEQFADIKIMKFQVPGFEDLKLNQKILVYYLSQAALCGRDIIFDQNYKHNILIRRTLEIIYVTYSGDKSNPEFDKFYEYLKRVWFSNGIHHHSSTDKFFPDFSEDYFKELVLNSDITKLPFQQNENIDAFITRIIKIIFDPKIDIKRVSQNSEEDLVLNSANNFYEKVTQKEAEEYYSSISNENDKTPVSIGLNSQLIKDNGKIIEKT